ncbi:MAG: DUF3800 domain-containing protein [Gemmatimonadaceae bacterium]
MCAVEQQIAARLVGYFDDSRHKYEDSRFGSIFVIAGYVASDEVWERHFIPKWTAVLRDAPHPITEFKTSDCRQRKGEFAKWTRDECDTLTKALIGVITDDCPPKSMHGIATAVELPDVQGYEEYGFFNAVGMSCLLATAVCAHHAGDGATMQFVFDRQPTRQQRMEEEFQDALERARDLSNRRGFDTVPNSDRISFGDSRVAVPLQAADLLAYETYKEIKGRHKVNSRPISRALERLVEGQTHFAVCLDPPRIFANQRVERFGWHSEFEPPAPLFMTGVPIRADWLHPHARLQLRFLYRLRYRSRRKAMEAAAGWSKTMPAVLHYVVREGKQNYRVSRDLEAVAGSVVTGFIDGEEVSNNNDPRHIASSIGLQTVVESPPDLQSQ